MAQKTERKELMLTIAPTGSCVLFLYSFCTFLVEINEIVKSNYSWWFFTWLFYKKKKEFKQAVDKIYVDIPLFLLG